MTDLNRRKWIRNSLLASSALLVGGRSGALDAISTWENHKYAQLLRLNWNENPFGPSEKAIAAISEALQNANRYPDALVKELKLQLADKYSATSEQIILTAGSTEVLSLLGQHVGLKKGEILTPWPSFPTMIVFGEVCGASIRKVPLDQDDRIDLEQTLNSINDKTTLVFICNPNNPTSTELGAEELKRFCRAVPENVLICVDEAYIEYSKYGTRSSMIPLVRELPNLIVCRTFSKAYGLAGLRIGYAVSQKMNIDALKKRHLGWQLSTSIASIIGVKATLGDEQFIARCIRGNEKGRQILYSAFDQWEISYNRSSTNFVYAESKRFDKDVITKLRDQNVLITKWPDMTKHIRISIGKPEEMESFVDAAKAFLI